MHHIRIVCENQPAAMVICGFDPIASAFVLTISREGQVVYSSAADSQSPVKDEHWLFSMTAHHALALPRRVLLGLLADKQAGGSRRLVDHGELVQPEMADILLANGYVQMMSTPLQAEQNSGPIDWMLDTKPVSVHPLLVIASPDYRLHIQDELIAQALVQTKGYLWLDNEELKHLVIQIGHRMRMSAAAEFVASKY